MLNHFKIIKERYENSIYGYIDRIDLDSNSASYGTTPDRWNPMYEARSFAHAAYVLIIGYYLKGTKCYRDQKLLELASASLDGMNRYIYSDGSIDLRETNFHDPANCAFVVRDLIGPAAEVMMKLNEHTELEESVFSKLADIIKRLGKAMETLGFHTPNHRWVISSALAYVYKITKDENALEIMRKFFWEGIDCDEYGEYTERSTGTYNKICDMSFLQLTQVTGDKKYLEYAVRNMKLMRSFYEPDNTICTLNSMRQDRGKSPSIAMYYGVYLPLAIYTEDPEFAYYADRIFKNTLLEEDKTDNPRRGLDPLGAYWFIMNEDWEKKMEEIPAYLPERDLDIYLPKSGTARVLDGGRSLTVLRTTSPDFLKFQFGTHSVCARAGGSFFGFPHAQFRPKTMEKTENGFRLISHEEAGYRSQLETPPETSEWRMMDHSKRHIINIQHFDTTVDITPTKKGFAIDMEYSGSENIPTKLELLLDPDCKVELDQIEFVARPDDYIYLKNGSAIIRYRDGKVLKIDGGAYAHFYAENMRGTEPVPHGVLTLALTGSTPGKIHIEVTEL